MYVLYYKRVATVKGRRMLISLPIAEVSVNMLVLPSLGGLVGIISGIFGVVGSFLMPLNTLLLQLAKRAFGLLAMPSDHFSIGTGGH